ncbi:hypothetical protein KPATCC21470_1500 [Kitasatospora purpeofusca]
MASGRHDVRAGHPAPARAAGGGVARSAGRAPTGPTPAGPTVTVPPRPSRNDRRAPIAAPGPEAP